MKPTLSIIVPIYNVEDYLEQCVNSILNQPYTDFELILVDDGSPDNCGAICDAYALKDQRIKVIHKKNGGLSSARNAGIDIAKGEYFSFIDSDDFISKDYYQMNMEYLMTHPQTNILILQVCHYDNEKNEVVINKKRELICKMDIINYMLSMDYIGAAWINIYKRDIFNQLRYPEGKIFEDGYILTEIVEKASVVFITDIGLYYYRKRNNSIMQKKKTMNNWCDILSTHVKQLDYCFSIPDNKKLFLCKYKACHLALIHASIEYPRGPFQEYKEKFQSFNYNFLQLLKANNSLITIFKLVVLRFIGFDKMVMIYKLFGVYKNI
jgi:glycosyltransferase involved in cell wall biosynthesis